MINGEIVPDKDVIVKTFNVLKATQPIGDIYLASIDYKTIQQITDFDVRRVLRDGRDVERYLGIQRPLNDARVRQLNDYVNYVDATFPTSIIVAVDADYAKYDAVAGTLSLSNTRDGETAPSTAIRNVCRVLDGQHRIAGLEAFSGRSFDVLVAIFVGSDIADQGYIFATVNLEQTKVNKSLAVDLFELAKTRSPYKTCHNIAVALDRAEGSPFFRRIKRLGVSTPGRDEERLTQSTFVDALIGYISDDPKGDRDELLRGRRLPPVRGAEQRRLPLRNMFINGDDIGIGKIIENYFRAVKERWPNAWDAGGTGYILARTNGYRALMKVFGGYYNYLAAPGEFVTAERFRVLFDRVQAVDDDFTTQTFPPGSSGESALRKLFESALP